MVECVSTSLCRFSYCQNPYTLATLLLQMQIYSFQDTVLHTRKMFQPIKPTRKLTRNQNKLNLAMPVPKKCDVSCKNEFMKIK
jgi:hypothetical protein